MEVCKFVVFVFYNYEGMKIYINNVNKVIKIIIEIDLFYM